MPWRAFFVCQAQVLNYVRALVDECKLSVETGIESMVSNHVRPIRTVRYENPTDRIAESPTRSPSLGK